MIAPAAQLIRAPLAFLGSRPGLFVVLAFLLAVQNTYASTLVASLFLSRIGAGGMPFYYVLFAVVSIPIAALFSSVIDRFPRPFLFQNALGVFTLVTIILTFLMTLGSAWSYVAYLAVRVFEHLIFSVFYILFADYFTVTNAKRYAGRIALGVALGGLTGGSLLTVMTGAGGPIVAAALTPVLVMFPLSFGIWLTRRHRPLDSGSPASREGLIDSLKIVPRLLRRYPLVALMSGAMFLNILLQCIAEFLAFSIYTVHFPDIDELTAFLGLLNAGLNLLGFLIIVLFTDRQLPRLGVPKMNRIYPALDILSFGAVAVVPSLPAGILANMSYDPFEHGIDVPVATLNYNGIRFRFVGRVRVFIDGMIFPLGLAAAGLLLMIAQGRFDLRVIAAFGLVLSVVLFVLHWNIGKQYVHGLIEMLREGAVELDQVDTGLRVPLNRVDEIRAMLAGDARNALMGLQMAARSDGGIPVEEIATALATVPIAQARKHPPPMAGRLKAGPSGDYVLSVGRLEGNKRVDLVIRAMAHTSPGVRLVVAGAGPLRPLLEAAADTAGVADRVTFAGRVDTEVLVDLYAGALGIVFPPFDEDYGYITLEAFLARKPVVTTTDAGGPLEFVEHGVTGLIADPTPEAIGAAVDRLAADRRLAQSLGDAGYDRARAITWDGVVDRLLPHG